MNNTKATAPHRPAVIRLAQMLIYLAAVFNVNQWDILGVPSLLKNGFVLQ
ncbi:hypothetical protein MNQ98_14070 [Paenibacillus sp. N3/727]|nr:hypothetical protein [Paenibacillus sp. N3/727]UNK21063.1 hypothetical protein MNQ98_14070 [Paenibacillus sp. N3/727]